MKQTSATLKQSARSALSGHYGLMIGAQITASLLASAILVPFSLVLNTEESTRDFIFYQLAAFIVSLVASVLAAGLSHMHLMLGRGKTPAFRDLFSCFQKRPDRFILLYLISALASFLFMLPGSVFVVVFLVTKNSLILVLGLILLLLSLLPILYWALGTGLCVCLLLDNDERGVISSIRESFRLMRGNMMRRLSLYLSFIGLFLLGLCSCSIGFFWIVPYLQQSEISFYLDLTQTNGQQDFSA